MQMIQFQITSFYKSSMGRELLKKASLLTVDAPLQEQHNVVDGSLGGTHHAASSTYLQTNGVEEMGHYHGERDLGLVCTSTAEPFSFVNRAADPKALNQAKKNMNDDTHVKRGEIPPVQHSVKVGDASSTMATDSGTHEEITHTHAHHHFIHHCSENAVASFNGSMSKKMEFRIQNRAAVVLLEIGIAVHSIIIGISLGISGNEEFQALLIALVFHQFFEGLALGNFSMNFGAQKHYINIFIFFFFNRLKYSLSILITI